MKLEEDGEEDAVDKYKTSALKHSLSGDIKKHMELREQDLRTCVKRRKGRRRKRK